MEQMPKLQSDDEFSFVSQWEMGRGHVGEKSDDKLQLLSVSDDVHPSRRSFQPSELQHGIDMPPVSDEEKEEGSISTREGDGEGEVAATPRFMPYAHTSKRSISRSVSRPSGTLVTATTSAWNSSLRSGKSASVSTALGLSPTLRRK
jgi:hypothetical protein